jgi:hypothetical protein
MRNCPSNNRVRPSGDPRSDPVEMTGIGASAGDIAVRKQSPRPGLRVSEKAEREFFSSAAVEGVVARGFLLGHHPHALARART